MLGTRRVKMKLSVCDVLYVYPHNTIRTIKPRHCTGNDHENIRIHACVPHYTYAYVSMLEQFALLLRKQPLGASELQHPSTREMHTCASTWRHTHAGSLSWRSACVILHSLLSQPYHLHSFSSQTYKRCESHRRARARARAHTARSFCMPHATLLT